MDGNPRRVGGGWSGKLRKRISNLISLPSTWRFVYLLIVGGICRQIAKSNRDSSLSLNCSSESPTTAFEDAPLNEVEEEELLNSECKVYTEGKFLFACLPQCTVSTWTCSSFIRRSPISASSCSSSASSFHFSTINLAGILGRVSAVQCCKAITYQPRVDAEEEEGEEGEGASPSKRRCCRGITFVIHRHHHLLAWNLLSGVINFCHNNFLKLLPHMLEHPSYCSKCVLE